ncbi:MAG: GTP-binding protein [Candidatus Dojkabacteria bacterium]
MEKDFTQENIRNVAIIAHVDHGKTTLVDALMKQTHLFRDNQEEMTQERILDSGDLEREKGITINAKNIAIVYRDTKINIIDTPGHADFGGEVERTLNMADSCLLLVDAQEGVMPQTKFVLKKALHQGLKVIVVINKIDKKLADCKKTLSKIQDLFLELANNTDQLDFPVFYGISREGKIFKEIPTGDLTQPNSTQGDISPILDEIVDNMPAPKGTLDGPFQMQITSLEYDNHLGRYLIGRINRGKVSIDDPVVILKADKDGRLERSQGRVRELFTKNGISWEETKQAFVGDIVAVAGIESLSIGATICSLDKEEILPEIEITPPSVRVKFEANTSPFAGTEGEFVTAKQLAQRLEQEKNLNVGLKIESETENIHYVSGRGELQLAILIEQLKREGYEFQLSKPEVILQKINGVISEPLEELVIVAEESYLSEISQEMSNRKGSLINIETYNGYSTFTYEILTRNIIGLHRMLMNSTKGTALINSYIKEYIPYKKQEEFFRKGVIISMESGTALAYALTSIQERGKMFIKGSTEVYEGMIIGINNHEDDLVVNPCKSRHKSNVRMSHAEVTEINLKATIPLTIEFALSFINDDELIEVTPKNIRLRKKLLTQTERVWSNRKNLTAFAKQQMGQSS